MVDSPATPLATDDGAAADITTARRTDFLFAVGAAFSTVGLGALICAFGPFFYAYGDEPLWLASAALLLPVGAALLTWPATRDAGRPPAPDPGGAPTPPAS